MRGIEFRGKAKSGDWFYGDLAHIEGWIYIGKGIFRDIRVIPETVGQWTGLLDKNGAKIFEGDIARYKGMELPVRWDTEKAGFFIGDDKYWMMNGIDIEAIGNIHDNPELLASRIKENDIF